MNLKNMLLPLSCLLSLSAGAQSVAFLEAVPDARGAGMGGVGVSTPADAWAVYWNAAKAVTAQSKAALDYSYSPWMKDEIEDCRMQRLGAYFRFGEKNAVVAGFRHIANGKFPLMSDNGQYLGTVNPEEFAFEAGFARSLCKGLSVGATVRYLRSDMGKLEGAEAADAAGFDLSLYYRTGLEMWGKKSALSFGLQVADLGSRIKYARSEYALPARLAAGGTWSAVLSAHHRLGCTAELGYRLLPSESRSVSGGVGLEYGLYDILYFRTGYHWGDIGKTTGDYVGLGAGLHYKYATLGFAWRCAVEDNDPLDKTMTLTVGFNF